MEDKYGCGTELLELIATPKFKGTGDNGFMGSSVDCEQGVCVCTNGGNELEFGGGGGLIPCGGKLEVAFVGV